MILFGFIDSARCLVVIVLVVLDCVWFSSSMFVYHGFELNTANHYFDVILPKYTSFNSSAYFAELEKCNEERICSNLANKNYGEASKLWQPIFSTSLFRYHHIPDCQYSFNFAGAYFNSNKSTPLATSDISINLLRFVTFEFWISESCADHSDDVGCKLTGDLLGGSTFYVFAYTANSIATCSVGDNFDGRYQVLCHAPAFPSRRLIPRCLQLTISLEHEHFDSLSLVQQSWTDSYSIIRKVLLDNVSYCADQSALSLSDIDPVEDTLSLAEEKGTTSSAHVVGVSEIASSLLTGFTSKSPREPHHLRQLTAHVPIYSGIWMKQDVDTSDINFSVCMQPIMQRIRNCHNSLSTPALQAECHVSWLKGPNWNSSQLISELTSSSLNRFESIAMTTQRRWCYNDIAVYKYAAQKYIKADPGMPTITLSSDLPREFTFRPVAQLVRRDHSVLWTVPTYKSTQSLLDQTRRYHFIGASHLRYVYLGLIEAVYGNGVLAKFDRKISNALHYNMSFIATHEMDKLVDAIKSFCAETTSQNIANAEIIFQSGDWDLTVSAIRSLRHPHYSRALVTLLRDLLEERYECPNVKHIVFVTAVPYPVCTSDLGEYCADQRSYRTNTAIGAFNTYMIQQLLSISVAPSKKLSIVDAFSIVLPRIMFNENIELGCTNHFSCAVETRKHTEMIHGFSGMAILQSVIYALTNSLP